MGWVGALAAALCYGVASVAQSVGVRSLATVRAGSPAHHRIWAGRWYIAGLTLDGVGFVASVAALQALPLFVVQAAVAASVGVTALAACLVLRARLSSIQVAALVVLAAGLVALASAAPTQSARTLSAGAGWTLAAAVVPLAMGTAAASRRPRHAKWDFPVLAACAGLGFAGVGIAARVLVLAHPWWATLITPPVWALAGYGLTAAIAFALALARGPVTVATAWTLAAETVVPAIVGLAVLGDHVRPGHTAWMAAGLTAVLVACLALAGRAQPNVQRPNSGGLHGD